jgi:hypothetical protein
VTEKTQKELKEYTNEFAATFKKKIAKYVEGPSVINIVFVNKHNEFIHSKLYHDIPEREGIHHLVADGKYKNTSWISSTVIAHSDLRSCFDYLLTPTRAKSELIINAKVDKSMIAETPIELVDTIRRYFDLKAELEIANREEDEKEAMIKKFLEAIKEYGAQKWVQKKLIE